jgi:predicted secreted protein
MALKHARGVKLLLKIGNGADPEQFFAKCSINAARGITFTAATNEFEIPNCDDPDQIAWVAREKKSISVALSGAGMLDTTDVSFFFEYLTDENSRNCQVVVDVPSADGGVVFEGAYHLTDFSITGDRGAKQECSISLASDGEVTCVAND